MTAVQASPAEVDDELIADIAAGAARRDATAELAGGDRMLLEALVALPVASHRLVARLAEADAALAYLAAAHLASVRLPSAEGSASAPSVPAFGLRAVTPAAIVTRIAAAPAVIDAASARTPLGQTGFDELLQAALDLGLLTGFLGAAREFLITKARPWHEAGAERAADDPHTIAAFGDAYARRQALELLVEDAARRLEAQPADVAALRPVVLARAYASARVARTINSVIGVLGASGAAGGVGLDRYWRDARAHALRRPALWSVADLEAAS